MAVLSLWSGTARFSFRLEFAFPNQRMVPTAKAAALPGDCIDRGGDHFETLRPKRLREVRHVVADDDCLLI